MRRQDWPERLAEYLEAAHARPFRYGAHDCGTFAAGAVEAVTGVNPIADLTYDRKGAIAIMEGGLHAFAAERLGPEIRAAFAQRGDVVGFIWQGRETLGVCAGTHIAAPGPDGLLYVPMSTAVKAWRYRCRQ